MPDGTPNRILADSTTDSLQMKHKLLIAIKYLSVILVTSAIGLELWHFSVGLTQSQIPARLQPIFWIERFALVVHGIEAAIAVVYAPRKQQSPISYGIYTFFVGTVGLVELVMNEAMIEPQE